MNLLLVGAGGHAKAIREALAAAGDTVTAYVDPKPAEWLEVQHFVDDAAADAYDEKAGMVVGIGGIDPAGLHRRLAVLDRYLDAGREIGRAHV